MNTPRQEKETARTTIDRIDVYRDRIGYSADFARTSEGPAIQDLFNTTILPLPFTKFADPIDVVSDVMRRNPNAIVSFREV